MGSGYWLKKIISLKRTKGDRNKKVEGLGNGGTRSNVRTTQLAENVAATTIQSAFRAYLARKALRRLKGTVRFRRIIEERYAVKKQAPTALDHIHFWSWIQAEIKARRLGMVVDGRTRQKKLQNQLKLETKLNELEMEWCGGPETMEEILDRIQQREEAAIKRERAMAYAFSHQWRANSGQCFGRAYYDIGKENWGWSWKERWIAVRPWEIQARSAIDKKLETKHKPSETTISTSMRALASVKPHLSSAKFSKT